MFYFTGFVIVLFFNHGQPSPDPYQQS